MNDNFSSQNMQEQYVQMNQYLFDKINQYQIVMDSLCNEKTEQEEKLAIKYKELEVLNEDQNSVKNLFTLDYNTEKREVLTNEIELIQEKIGTLDSKKKAFKSDNDKFLEISEYLSEWKEDKIKDQYKQTVYGEMGIRILRAQEDERQRIASDIHDTTVQNLTYLIHKTELCIKLLEIDQIRAKLELTSMTSTIKSVINDMRDIIYDLKPMSLDDLGFVVTLERYINQMMISHDIKIKLNCKSQIEKNLPLVKLALFRVIQEACWNVIKHANATQIDIDIDINIIDHTISVVIKDNGNGFNILDYQSKALERNTGFGLSIMKERVGLLSGKIDIRSSEGAGTIIDISIPIITCKEEKDE